MLEQQIQKTVFHNAFADISLHKEINRESALQRKYVNMFERLFLTEKAVKLHPSGAPCRGITRWRVCLCVGLVWLAGFARLIPDEWDSAKVTNQKKVYHYWKVVLVSIQLWGCETFCPQTGTVETETASRRSSLKNKEALCTFWCHSFPHICSQMRQLEKENFDMKIRKCLNHKEDWKCNKKPRVNHMSKLHLYNLIF